MSDPSSSNVWDITSIHESSQQPPAGPTTDSSPAEFPSHRIADRYELLEKLGEGGMGEVWVAKQFEPVKRKVAVKLIKAGMDSKAVLARFDQERQALALMDHPNIAKVLDGGLTADRRPYFVMELVNGLPLSKYCDQAKLTLKQRLELFVPICQAVQHAHQKGIIHRDLKPANILVTRIDGNPVPKVIDFGVAKATGGKLTDDTLSTQFGAVIGTLEYMSPEQAGFSGVDVDTRSDVYSLGVILYELLTGLRPLDTGRLRKVALSEMIRVIQEEEPAKPSTKLSADDALPSLAALRQVEPRKLMELLRGELDWVVMKCLEKQRDRRYETVGALARDVQRYLADEVVEARPPSLRYRVGKFTRKNRIGIAVAFTIFGLLLAGITVSTIQTLRALRAEQAALEESGNAREAERLARERADELKAANEKEAASRQLAERRRAAAEAVSKFLSVDMITFADPERAQGREITVKESLDRAAEKVTVAFAKQPEIEALIRAAIGKTYLGLGKFAEAEKHYGRAHSISVELFGDTHEDTLDLGNQLAAIAAKTDRLDDAEQQYRTILKKWEAIHGPNHRGTFATANDLALLLHHRGKDEEAERILRDVANREGTVRRNDGTREWNGQVNLALIVLERGRPTEAEPLARAAYEGCLTSYGDKHPDTLSAANTLAEVLKALGKTEEGIPLLRRVVEMRRHVQGPEHTDTLIAIGNLASILHARNKLDEAEPLYRESLEGFRKTRGDEHSLTLTALNNTATFLVARRKYDEAEPLFRRAMAALIKLQGPDHVEVLTVAGNLAVVLSAQGKNADAATTLRTVVEGLKKTSGPKHPTTAQMLHNLADTLRELKEWNESEKYFREALAIWKEKLPKDHPNTVGTTIALGWELTDAGKPNEAEPLLRDALDTVRRILPKGHPSIAHVQSLLGGCLSVQGKYSEAEPLLVEGYEAMVLSPIAKPERLRLARDRAIKHFELTGMKSKADEWQKKPVEPPAKK